MSTEATKKRKALMILKGVTSVSIARKERVTTTWVSLVLNGKKKSLRIQKAIADALGKPVEELWPNGNNKAA